MTLNQSTSSTVPPTPIGPATMETGWVRRLEPLSEQIDSLRLLRVSVVHWFVLVVWCASLWRFTGVYQAIYAKSALLATLVTNVLLWGISDALAQAIHCYAAEAVDPLAPVLPAVVEIDSDDLSVFNDYGGGAAVIGMGVEEEVEDAPDTYFFDFYRWVCFMAWGFTLSFFQVPWYKFLNFFYTEDPTVVQVLERVLSDQLLYSPVSLYCFFMYSSYVMERGDAATFSRKIQRLYVSTLGCNYLVWPAVQFVNFLAVPKHLQVPFSSSVGVMWNCFLSMRNAAR